MAIDSDQGFRQLLRAPIRSRRHVHILLLDTRPTRGRGPRRRRREYRRWQDGGQGRGHGARDPYPSTLCGPVPFAITNANGTGSHPDARSHGNAGADALPESDARRGQPHAGGSHPDTRAHGGTFADRISGGHGYPQPDGLADSGAHGHALGERDAARYSLAGSDFDARSAYTRTYVYTYPNPSTNPHPDTYGNTLAASGDAGAACSYSDTYADLSGTHSDA